MLKDTHEHQSNLILQQNDSTRAIMIPLWFFNLLLIIIFVPYDDRLCDIVRYNFLIQRHFVFLTNYQVSHCLMTIMPLVYVIALYAIVPIVELQCDKDSKVLDLKHRCSNKNCNLLSKA